MRSKPKAKSADPLEKQAIQASLHLEEELAATQRLALDFEKEVESLSNQVAERLEGEISMQAATVRSLLATLEVRLQDKDPQLAELARMGLRSTENLQSELKGILANLRRAEPEVHGLVESLDRLVKDWRAKEIGVRFEFMSDPGDAPSFGYSETPIEAFVQKVAEAAVDRAVNLGAAKLVVVSVTRTKTELRLQVIDDGGPPARTPGHHWRSLKQKATALGGRLQLEQADSGGGEMLLKLDWIL